MEMLSYHVGLTEDESKVRILDQSRLPNHEIFLELSGLEELIEAIVALRVRGAPAIGIFAGYAMYVLAQQVGGAFRPAGPDAAPYPGTRCPG